MNLTIFKSFELSLGQLSCPQLRKKVFPQMLRTSNLNYLLWNWINKINGRTTGINIIYHINCVYMCVSLQAHYSVRMLLLLSRFSHVWLCATPWTAAYQAPPSMGFSRQEYWSGLPLPSPWCKNSRRYNIYEQKLSAFRLIVSSLNWKWQRKWFSRVWLFVTAYSPWNSLGQNTGVGSHSFLQGIFPTQGLNPGLLHCKQILYHLSH